MTALSPVRRKHRICVICKGYEDYHVLKGIDLTPEQGERIAICRCLMMKPRVLLFDEPTSSLDPAMVGEMLAVIRQVSAPLCRRKPAGGWTEISNRDLQMDGG